MTHEFQPLNQLLSVSRLHISDVIRYALNISAELRRLHADGRCHGALTPELIQIGESAAYLLPATPDAAGSLTPYRAPETLQDGSVDMRTDIFSFGALLYEMATGRRAFPSEDPEALTEQILSNAFAPTGHEGLDLVISRCLAKDPAARWQKMQNVQMQLKLAAIAEQQSGTSILAHLETVVNEELTRQANAIVELDRAVATRTSELTQAVNTALDNVQSQFVEVETFLATSEQRADHFGRAATQAVEAARRDIATLHAELTGEVNALAHVSKAQAASLESLKTSLAWNEDCVERVVDSLQEIQNVIFRQTPLPETNPLAIAS